MERRRVLQSVAGVATASTVGLAGCSGGSGGGDGNGTATGTGSGGGSGCSTPDDLESTLPGGEDYTMNGEASTTEGSEVTTGTISAAYTGPDGDDYSYTLTAYTEAQYAQDPNTDAAVTDEDEVAAYVVIDTHLYNAVGPSKEKVKSFLATSSALEMGCIESNVQWSSN